MKSESGRKAEAPRRRGQNKTKAVPKNTTPKRRRLDPNEARAMILDAVGRLMHRGGYAAISTRRVATEAGLKSPLVHYYYPTLDDLLIAFYRRAAAHMRDHAADIQASPHPLYSLWEVNISPERGALGAEFLALAKHRKSIRDEIAREVEAVRDAQAEVFKPLLRGDGLVREIGSPEGAALLFSAIARALVVEQQIGVSKGHADVKRFIERSIKRLENGTAPTKSSNK